MKICVVGSLSRLHIYLDIFDEDDGGKVLKFVLLVFTCLYRNIKATWMGNIKKLYSFQLVWNDKLCFHICYIYS